jgi:hypothetical protein
VALTEKNKSEMEDVISSLRTEISELKKNELENVSLIDDLKAKSKRKEIKESPRSGPSV